MLKALKIARILTLVCFILSILELDILFVLLSIALFVIYNKVIKLYAEYENTN